MRVVFRFLWENANTTAIILLGVGFMLHNVRSRREISNVSAEIVLLWERPVCACQERVQGGVR